MNQTKKDELIKCTALITLIIMFVGFMCVTTESTPYGDSVNSESKPSLSHIESIVKDRVEDKVTSEFPYSVTNFKRINSYLKENNTYRVYGRILVVRYGDNYCFDFSVEIDYYSRNNYSLHDWDIDFRG